MKPPHDHRAVLSLVKKGLDSNAASLTPVSEWSQDDLRAAVEMSTSLREVALLIAGHSDPATLATIRTEVERHKISTEHFLRGSEDPRGGTSNEDRSLQPEPRKRPITCPAPSSASIAALSTTSPVPHRAALPPGAGRNVVRSEPEASSPRLQGSDLGSADVEEQIFGLAERCALPFITRRTAQTRAKFGVEANEHRVIRDTTGRLLKGLAGEDDLMMQLTYIVRATTKNDARLMALVIPRNEQYKRLLAQALIQCLALCEQQYREGVR